MATIYRLFGGFDRLIDPLSSPKDAALPPSRARGLLALLLLSPGKRWTRSALARVLCPGDEIAERLPRLSDHLHLIRKSCPEIEILSDSESMTWTGHGATTDYSLFIQATQGAAAQSGNEALVAALDLYQGELLPEFDLSPVNEAREHARVRFNTVLRVVAQRHESTGRLTEAQKWYERWLLTNPTDEEVLVKYLKLCRDLGHRARALLAYKAAESSLAELSIRPGIELRNLALELQVPATRVRNNPAHSFSDAASKIDRAWWLLSEIEATACLETLENQDRRFPGWELRRLMIYEIRGQWGALGEQSRQCLGAKAGSGPALNPSTQAMALILLGRAQAEVESVASSLRSLDKAASLLRQTIAAPEPKDSPFSPFAPAEALIAWVELLQFNLQMRSGNSETAIEAGRRLLGRLEDLGNVARNSWVSVLTLRVSAALGGILLQVGRSLEAIAELDRAQALSTELKALEFQNSLAITRASALDNLGRWDESAPLLEAASLRFVETGDRFERGKCLYNRAAHLGNRPDGDRQTACRLAATAIEDFRSVGAEGWEASTQTTLGFLLWQSGEPRPALEAYARARALHTKLEEDFYITEIHAYEALCHLDVGEVDLALAKSQAGIEAGLEGSDTAVSVDLWIVRAECLRAANRHEEVLVSLTRAGDLLFAQASELADTEACAGLLRRDPLIRTLIERLREVGTLDHYLMGLPAAAFRSPRSQGAATSVNLRRIRIKEARERLKSRGEIASAARLARIVGAGVRTVERDLAALKLRRAGGPFPG